MSQSTVASLILIVIISSMFGYIVGSDDRERSKSSQQIEQTSQQKEGDTK